MPHVILVSASAVLAASFAACLPAQVPEKGTRLGEVLFSSTALSKGRTTSCTTCHDPKKSFADGLRRGEGRDADRDRAQHAHALRDELDPEVPRSAAGAGRQAREDARASSSSRSGASTRSRTSSRWARASTTPSPRSARTPTSRRSSTRLSASQEASRRPASGRRSRRSSELDARGGPNGSLRRLPRRKPAALDADAAPRARDFHEAGLRRLPFGARAERRPDARRRSARGDSG